MRRRAGFTLIELAVVLSAVVVLSGVLIVRVSGWTPRQSLHRSARAFGGTLRVWRERARFDEAAYRVAWTEKAWSVTSSAGERLAGGALDPGQSFEAPGEFSFDRRGVALPASVALRHVSGARVAVVVQALHSDPSYEEMR